jgi:RluA family pseudouridine synthase
MKRFTIVYADADVVVADKAAGLLSVAAAGQECLVDLLQAELDRQRFGRFRLAVVHRLDRQTSGLLVFARTPTAAARLSKELAAHRFERAYIAIVSGLLADARGTIDSPLDGKRAVTHFETTRRHADATTVRVRLQTGRRNQIRRHFAEFGHPLWGDERFGAHPHPAWPFDRVALHAQVLGFTHPRTRRLLRFESPPPAPFGEPQSPQDIHG